MTLSRLEPEFVEYVPTGLHEGTLYLSLPYATAVHLCACGCRTKVVTPFSPADWKLTFDGETVTLSPSIGNWQLPCRSHYWIKRNRVVWSTAWSKKQIDDGRERDARALRTYFDNEHIEVMDDLSEKPTSPECSNFWSRLKSCIRRRFGSNSATD